MSSRRKNNAALVNNWRRMIADRVWTARYLRAHVRACRRASLSRPPSVV